MRAAAHRTAQEAGVHQHIVVVHADKLLTHRAAAGSHDAVPQAAAESERALASRLAQRTEGQRGGWEARA